MAPFDQHDIERSFTKTIMVRGLDYVRTRHVLEAWYTEAGSLCGTVSGSERTPYRVTIAFVPRSKFTELETDCTCPYSSQCKHAAAVALYALTHELRVETIDSKPIQEREIELPVAPPMSAEIPIPLPITSWLGELEAAVLGPESASQQSKLQIIYALGVRGAESGSEVPIVTATSRKVLKSGELGLPVEIKISSIEAYSKPAAWTTVDRELLVDLYRNTGRFETNKAEFRLDGKHGDRLLREILATGRARWQDDRPLRKGEPRRGVLAWEPADNKGQVRPRIAFAGKGRTLAIRPPWYVDIVTCECGPLECEAPPEVAAAFSRGGSIAPEHVAAVRDRLTAMGLKDDALPRQELAPVIRAPNPVPCLTVDFESCEKNPDYYSNRKIAAPVAFAKLNFEYEGFPAPANGSDIRRSDKDQILILRRNPQAEQYAKDFLERCGWDEPRYSGWEIPKGRGTSFCIVPPDSNRLLEPLERVAAFAKNVVPRLTAAGWKIDIDQNYRYIPDSAVEWNVGIDGKSGIDWFEFQLGIRVEGQPYDLRPVLASLFKELGSAGQSMGAVARTQKSDDLFMFGENGQVIRLSRKRLVGILQPLMEIFGGVEEWPTELRLTKALFPEAGKLQESLGDVGLEWKTNDELQQLGDRFASFDHLEPMAEPAGFCGELRGYQREGLAWLQFLREFGFGGVLADDMGLGKTVQVLAHIQTEKEAGRMDRPCLIVAPTSTIPNWRRECERFVPGLKVLSLQGIGRTSRFSELQQVDIALTTYPLLARDKGALLRSPYHMVVLDEAQNVKNPATGAAKAARELVGRHKLCMSGTPVENHLGELWSLFQFLMPGFLGTDSDFKKRFRGPIEKSGDQPARERLARRVRPFMLRRTKGQVVKELPPKTEIIENVAFDDPQRDLYESIRMAMDEQVRRLIAAQGFEKSRIQILDALLKLRQVCCDPRLVKLPAARAVTQSAKLERLLEMLGELLEGGRKVLLFSQFTSMLDLIEAKLREQGIQWVRISGDTIDRDTPVRRFQAGEVPLFLISLKAGGTGLNLTAADTVILYDPWWNPAVENQAIDRAHRIGQDKAVIVYKLVASGTIEEKMLEMQARKGDIARSILTDDAEGIRTLTADDLRWVLSGD